MEEIRKQIAQRGNDLQEVMDMIDKEYNDLMKETYGIASGPAMDTRGTLKEKREMIQRLQEERKRMEKKKEGL